MCSPAVRRVPCYLCIFDQSHVIVQLASDEDLGLLELRMPAYTGNFYSPFLNRKMHAGQRTARNKASVGFSTSFNSAQVWLMGITRSRYARMESMDSGVRNMF